MNVTVPAGLGMDDAGLLRLARDFGTPSYVFDARVLADRIAYLREMLPEGVGLCFAMKANTFVLPELVSLVDRIEACSPGELRICERMQVPAGAVVVSGVHKDVQTVDAALRWPEMPAAVTVESRAQMDLVLDRARACGACVPLLLRLTSGNQFGVDAGELKQLARRALDDPHADLRGVQFFSGTQKTSLKRIGRELSRVDRLLSEMADELGWEAPELEYGPGLPVAYFAGDAFDETAFLAELAGLLEGMAWRGHVTLEVGRSMVASCGTYLTRVEDAKENAGARYAIVDGGMHHLAYYGQSMAMRQPPCRLLSQAGGAPADEAPAAGSDLASEAWNICGSLCTANDLIAKQMPLAGLRTGDVLAFGTAGAYCATEGISLFLSRDLPRVLVVDRSGEARLVRDALPTDPLNSPTP